jgi:protoporphyrinogen oxidase
MPNGRVIVLGAGPAGVGAAYRLRAAGTAEVVVVEQAERPGGNSGSFEFAGQRLDYGSHRLHPSCDPAILADVRRLLGRDLLDRPRHGRIRLRGRWIHFPLKPLDLLLRLDPAFALGTARDAIAKPFRRPSSEDTFASVLGQNLGPTICESFYYPYAVKLWGHPASSLSGIQARRRVGAGSFGKLARKVLSQVPGFKPPGAGRFYYPRRGYGQISEAYADAAAGAGAEIRLGWRMIAIDPPASSHAPWRVVIERDGARETVEADHLWSTIPITVLARAMGRSTPSQVSEAAGKIGYRAMVLIYLQLDQDRFTEFDAHYFPEAAIRITRLSEPKNYAALLEPRGSTVLCAELPCDLDDDVWRQPDPALGELVQADLERAGIPLRRPPVAVMVRRLPRAYPVYLNGYERWFATLDEWANGLDRAITYGRQGLFAHDNTHHALFMAYRAVDCLSHQGFDRERWREFRRVFDTHVVED